MKYIITEQQYGNAIDKYISYQFEPHEEIEHKYSTDVYWVKNGRVIARIDKDNKYFLVIDKILKSISDIFSLNHFETEDVIKIWLERNYGWTNLTLLNPNSIEVT